MISKRTKECKIRKIIFTILHFLCLFGPFLYYIPMAFATGEVVSKICLGLTTIVALILAALSFISDVSHRAGLHKSIMWTLIGGLLFCLDAVAPFIGIMTVCSILDELVFVRLKEHYKQAELANKEIDRRT